MPSKRDPRQAVNASPSPRSDPVAVSPRRSSPRSPTRSPVGSPRSAPAVPSLVVVPAPDSEDERDEALEAPHPQPRRSGGGGGGGGGETDKKTLPRRSADQATSGAAVVVVPSARQLVLERRRRSQQPADDGPNPGSFSPRRGAGGGRRSGDDLLEGSPRAPSPRRTPVAGRGKKIVADGALAEEEPARLSDCPLDDIMAPRSQAAFEQEVDDDDEDIDRFFRKK